MLARYGIDFAVPPSAGDRGCIAKPAKAGTPAVTTKNSDMAAGGVMLVDDSSSVDREASMSLISTIAVGSLLAPSRVPAARRFEPKRPAGCGAPRGIDRCRLQLADTEKLAGYPPVAQAVGMIAGDCASLPLHVYERDGRDRQLASDHEAENLITLTAIPTTSPLPSISGLTSTTMHCCDLGLLYIERVGNRAGLGCTD